ncbi:MAG: hypothetical protein ACI9HK_001234 [Pirellulaceae bacterium]|jgi:hypothetical protein
MTIIVPFGAADQIKHIAHERLTLNCPYARIFRDVAITPNDGVLVLEGRVPSFYLKQILQTLLKDIDGVVRIDNQVDVVSSTG